MSRQLGRVTEAILAMPPADDKKVHRCQGYATSKKRNCRNPIGIPRVKKRQDIVKKLITLSLSDAVDSEFLLELVDVCLCIKHGNDEVEVENLLAKFQQQLEDAATVEKKKQEERERALAKSSRQTTPGSAAKTQQAQQRRNTRQPTPGADDEVQSIATGRSQRARAPPSPPATPQVLRRSGLAGRSRATASPEPIYSRNSPVRNNAVVPKEVHEVTNDEADGSQSSEDDEDGAVSALSFSSSWTKYQIKWNRLDQLGRRRHKDLEDVMPWPVVSGQYQHVNACNVHAFYENLRKICEDDNEYMVFIMAEYDRWSRENLRQLLTSSIFKGVYSRSFGTIFKVVQDIYGDTVNLPVL